MNLYYTVVLFYLIGTEALKVQDIRDCPSLIPRDRPTSVYDLRVDDIEVIAALGDSVTAGMVAENANGSYITRNDFVEYRGSSWIMGGDENAPSLANYIKHYRPDLYGASKGSKPARLCPRTFFCTDPEHTPEIDVLNAAQSGATSKELNEQVDYLIERIGNDTPLAKKWKLINLFIGFNDASLSCLPGKSILGYALNVKIALERLIDNVDYAFINLVGLMHYDEIIGLADRRDPQYKKHFEKNDFDLIHFECYCCSQPNGGTRFIRSQITDYNLALSLIAEQVSGTHLSGIISPILGRKSPSNVAVVYQPINPAMITVSHLALSNVDAYHPNVHGYQYMSRALWNQMFLPKNSKIQSDAFNTTLPFYCPTSEDRLRGSKPLF